LGSRELIVPCGGGECGARNEGSEEVVEGKREGGGPSADKQDFYESVGKFAGGAPEAERAAKVFEVYGDHDVDQSQWRKYDHKRSERMTCYCDFTGAAGWTLTASFQRRP